MATTVIHTVDATADETKVLLADAAGNNTKNIYRVMATNPNAVDSFVQFFDAAAAADVTLGTTVADWVCFVPAGTSTTVQGAVIDDFYNAPIQFQKGIVYAVTTTVSGSTAPTADGVLAILHR